MNKRELIARVQRHMGAGATREAARAAVNAVLGSILQAAEEEERVHLAQLGSFAYQPHRTRSGKGLRSGEHAERPTRRLCFRPAAKLKKNLVLFL